MGKVQLPKQSQFPTCFLHMTVSAECRWGASGKSDKYMRVHPQKGTMHYSLEGTMWAQWRWDTWVNNAEAHLPVKNQDSVSVKVPQECMWIHNNLYLVSAKLVKAKYSRIAFMKKSIMVGITVHPVSV